jgi:hypothetical protein
MTSSPMALHPKVGIRLSRSCQSRTATAIQRVTGFLAPTISQPQQANGARDSLFFLVR